MINPELQGTNIIHMTVDKIEKSAPTVSLFLVNKFFSAEELYFHPIFICIAKQHPIPPVLFLVLHLLSQTPTKLHPPYWSIFRLHLRAVMCATKYLESQ